MATLDVVVLEHKTAYQGYMRLDQYQLKHTVFDGSWSIDLSREVLERGHAVAVLPYDPVADKVVLIEQFRIGGYTSPKSSPWQIECVAGMIEPQQLPEDAAYRETQEETGLRILDLWVNAVLIRMPKVVKSWTTSSEDYTLFRADPQKNNASTTFIFTI